VLIAAFAAYGSWASVIQAQVGDVFVIALENHNFTQTYPTSSPEQLQANTAAPYLNSLITSGNSNAAQVSYATNYTNAGNGVHPSEPNYVWAEAGTNFNQFSTVGGTTNTRQGVLNGTTIVSDSDPSTAAGNLFPSSFAADHLSGQLNAAGISWDNYQEDFQYSSSPLVSAAGTDSTPNVYNGSLQYNYAVKHNPMAFFADTGTQNVYQLGQLATKLANNTVGRYNWITPDQYNDMHTALSSGFTYQGTHYTGDQAAVAQGDNFLSIIVPQIEASQAYKNNGVIIIWDDESEWGDTSAYTLPEIVISPLAKGNAYASSVPMSHSSDLATIDAIFGLQFQNNPIPSSETSAAGGYNAVSTVNDLSSLFVSGAIHPNGFWNVDSNGFWSVGSNWTNSTVPSSGTVSFAGVPGYPYGPNVPVTITLDGTETAAALLFNTANGNGYSLVAGASGTLALGTSSAASITVLGGSHAITAPIAIGANLAVSIASGASLQLSGPINETTPLSGLTKIGGGELVLSGSNSYTGGTSVINGVLIVANNYSLADGSSLTVGNAGLFSREFPADADVGSVAATPVPEPSTLALFGFAAISVFWRKRSRR
jgi:autotransporter-associated beta strand protein